MACTACSGRAVESTIMALSPPVSAMSGAPGARFSAIAERIFIAVSVEPVKATPSTRASEVRAAPTSPAPGNSCRAVFGTPARCMSLTATWAMSGVCSAGFDRTALPAARAALICPVKMASGKFQGEMQVKVPTGSPSGALAA